MTGHTQNEARHVTITETIWKGKRYKEEQSIWKLLSAQKEMEKNNLKSFKIMNPAVKKTKADIGRQEGREKQRE